MDHQREVLVFWNVFRAWCVIVVFLFLGPSFVAILEAATGEAAVIGIVLGTSVQAEHGFFGHDPLFPELGAVLADYQATVCYGLAQRAIIQVPDRSSCRECVQPIELTRFIFGHDMTPFLIMIISRYREFVKKNFHGIGNLEVHVIGIFESRFEAMAYHEHLADDLRRLVAIEQPGVGFLLTAGARRCESEAAHMSTAPAHSQRPLGGTM